jgi:murein L,D-transpeptidase YcbB/YkuD
MNAVTFLPNATVRHLVLKPLILLIVLILLSGNSTAADKADELQQAMTAHLDCYPMELIDFDKQKPLLETKEFCLAIIYHETGAQPLWVNEDGPNSKARIIFDFLKRADAEGLDPADYEIFEIMELWSSDKPNDLARLDTLLTYNLVKYIHDMSYGQQKFRLSRPDLFAEAGNAQFDPLQAVEAARLANDLNAYLNSLAPRHRYYTNLKEALAQIKAQPHIAEWAEIPEGPLIKPGGSDPRLPAIRQRLAEEHGLAAETNEAFFYDDALAEAISLFQKRHGLETDAIIGPQTLAALNISLENKINIIRANMARWRWQAHDLGETYVMVNIAGFSLTAVHNGETTLDLPVIVGKSQHQTPVFSDSIKYLDFNPFWNVTPSIARNEELPALRKNPNHLVERNIRLFSSWQEDASELDSTAIDWPNISRNQMSRYKLRQDPGPWNALGRVKFVFPNHHSVYLHDTPARDLFDNSFRSFSHGCIRVSRPLDLALFALQMEDPLWSSEKIEAIVASGERKVIRLSKPLPIHITYQTVWLDKERIIHFNNDIYNRDARLLEVLLSK